ncbi:hypothetical protein [Paraflavitalea sp. CAU 1676]|uniref:alpha-d-galacturonidase n=1 Tax=Paraflavitalea sp. CAU 1676 TaxID=3032598 RepID=UPI0023DB1696|nr:hypothetical protein [Paraflavitalea sp. CAU 1676]MDF2190430.1 hypothetical protein [Paraflavitalea sp. CAU 1676]
MMRWMCRYFLILSGVVMAAPVWAQKKPFAVVVRHDAVARIAYGTEQISKALQETGYQVVIAKKASYGGRTPQILAGTLKEAAVLAYVKQFGVDTAKLGKEGFVIRRRSNVILIAGADASGALYGCLELAEQVRRAKALPDAIDLRDRPQMVLRGTCIGVQKPYYLPGRTVYEYPYTPETFPWFYDKKLWLQYLDTLVANRYNSLYLWNGHPFASLVKLKDYPYAVEVDEATFKKNEEMYRFLTQEADKRGIWVIQMFYNIIVSKPFAEHHGIKTQDRERPITPLIADYTRKSIAAFVEKYPNVGLLVCLGEAMEGVGKDDVEWFTKTIIPGVRDGLKALGRTDEPPIVLRAHDTDAPAVMKEALPLYKNLYTEAKFNGEALTTYTPRGPWAELHRTLSRIGTVQIENVHILANLEPFRYGSADFIQKSVQAMHSTYEANGLHLYPQASYWDWPYAADSTSHGLLLQVERDWIWYREWARYAWDAQRERGGEVDYWAGQLAERYGCSVEQGKQLLKAYEESGEIAPKLLRRFGITDGNRQTLTLGMTMPQLVNPKRFGLFELLYNSEGPEGEMLIEYAEKDWKGLPHIGETPLTVISEVRAHGQLAVDAIEAAGEGVTRNQEEFIRLKNDMLIYQALANHYAYKALAAMKALRYKYSGDLNDLKQVVSPLEASVSWYRKLTDLTKSTYRYANSMQTQQRKIPFRGVNATYKNWWEVLPEFEKELVQLNRRIDSLGTAVNAVRVADPVLAAALVDVRGVVVGRYAAVPGARTFGDSLFTLKRVIPELAQLEGIQTNWAQQVREGTTVSFTTEKPVKLLVGFFAGKKPGLLPAPELETNAAANDYGQAEVKVANGVFIEGLPAINIHTYSFKPGKNVLQLAKGACLLLGFAAEEAPLRVYDAGLQDKSSRQEVDWIFE